MSFFRVFMIRKCKYKRTYVFSLTPLLSQPMLRPPVMESSCGQPTGGGILTSGIGGGGGLRTLHIKKTSKLHGVCFSYLLLLLLLKASFRSCNTVPWPRLEKSLFGIELRAPKYGLLSLWACWQNVCVCQIGPSRR
jgi:hypothetical protein